MTPGPGTPAASFTPEGVFLDLLEVSLTAVNVLRPVYDPAGVIVDFTLDYLNPAAQRMSDLPERPGGTLLTLRPGTASAGIFAYYRRVFETGATDVHEVNYQAEGLDNYFRLAARRSGEWLVVSFTDTADQNRTPVELALREAQAAERAARAAAEQQRADLQRLFEQAPVALAVFQGPRYTVELANPEVLRLWGRTAAQALHTPLFELLPEITGQGFAELLDEVVATGVPHVAHEMPSTIDRHGRRDTVYWNFVYQPLRGADGAVTGVTVVATEVSEQVVARQQVQQLNQELEARVFERTQELRHAQAAQQRQEQQLRQILQQSPAMIATLEGPDHRVSFTNPGYDTLVGGRAQLGRPVAESLPEVVAQGFIDLLDGVYRTGEAFIGRETFIEFQPPGGAAAAYYLDFTYLALRDAHERITGILAFVVDVTERVRARQRAEAAQAQLLAAAEQAAAQREAFYQVFEQTPALVQLLRDPGHRVEYVNPAYQQLFPGRELVGRDLAEAAPELAAQGFLALMDRVYQTGETYHGIDTPFTPAPAAGQPARTAYYNFTYQPYREHNQIVGLSVFAFDVTEQVLARRERDAQRQRLTAVFAQAPVAICVFHGPDYVLDLVNPPMTLMLGRPLAALQGRPFFEALPELRAQGVPELLDGVRHTGVRFVAQERAVQLAHHAPGAPGYYNFVYEPLRDEQGAVAAVICVATDVSEQVRSRQQVQQLNQDLTAANQQLTRTNVDLDTFIYTASHDLKAPITNIEGLLATLRDELPAAVGGEVPVILDLMQDSVARFTHTIHHLTDVSRMQKESEQPTHAVPLAPVIEGVRLDLAPLLAQTGGRLDVDVQAVPTVLFSEKNLRSVVFNLLSNALKYRHPDRPPHVRVRARPDGAYAVLEVQDNGLGFDRGREVQLFAMFQRLHTHVEGSGVGLYMVKRLVENAGGRIAVESEVGTGTTFTVHLPR